MDSHLTLVQRLCCGCVVITVIVGILVDYYTYNIIGVKDIVAVMMAEPLRKLSCEEFIKHDNMCHLRLNKILFDLLG